MADWRSRRAFSYSFLLYSNTPRSTNAYEFSAQLDRLARIGDRQIEAIPPLPEISPFDQGWHIFRIDLQSLIEVGDGLIEVVIFVSGRRLSSGTRRRFRVGLDLRGK